jgi:hypothetical protein
MCITSVNFYIQIYLHNYYSILAALRAPCTECARPFRLIKALLLSHSLVKHPEKKMLSLARIEPRLLRLIIVGNVYSTGS